MTDRPFWSPTGWLLQMLREECGLSRQQMAAAVNVNSETIEAIESSRLLDHRLARNIAEVAAGMLDIAPEFLLTWVDETAQQLQIGSEEERIA